MPHHHGRSKDLHGRHICGEAPSKCSRKRSETGRTEVFRGKYDRDVPCCLRDLKERPLESPGCFEPSLGFVRAQSQSQAQSQAKPHQKAGKFN